MRVEWTGRKTVGSLILIRRVNKLTLLIRGLQRKGHSEVVLKERMNIVGNDALMLVDNAKKCKLYKKLFLILNSLILVSE